MSLWILLKITCQQIILKRKNIHRSWELLVSETKLNMPIALEKLAYQSEVIVIFFHWT